MANIFKAAEVLDMGISKEIKRRDFYKYAAEKFAEKDMKDLFSRLRDWEDEHIRKFTEIRNSIQDSEVQETYAGEFEKFVKAAVDDILYEQVSAEWFTGNVKTPIAAIQYGMTFEKDAILFFAELLKNTEPPYAEKIEVLINEEKKHLIYLAELKCKYQRA